MRSTDVADRLFSTSVTLWYKVPLPPNTPLSIGNLSNIANKLEFGKIAEKTKTDVLEVFAQDESASVQVGVRVGLEILSIDDP